MIIDPYTWHRLTIKSLEPISIDTLALRFNRHPAYTYRAGQYAVTRITKSDGQQRIRQYSFSSAPTADTLELLIQKEPSGEVSSWFHDEAKPGDVIEISQPLGNFTLDHSKKRPITLIAGRIGIAPFISMLRDRPTYPVSIIYSVRHENQVCYPELLASYDTRIISTLASPRIDMNFLKPLIENKPVFFICGSKQFVDAICKLLDSAGVRSEDIKRELFTLQ